MSIPLLAAGRTVTDLNTEVTEDTEITEPALGSSSPCTLCGLCVLCVDQSVIAQHSCFVIFAIF